MWYNPVVDKNIQIESSDGSYYKVTRWCYVREAKYAGFDAWRADPLVEGEVPIGPAILWYAGHAFDIKVRNVSDSQPREVTIMGKVGTLPPWEDERTQDAS